MLKSKRKTIIAGNWKMNKTFSQTKDLVSDICNNLPETNATIILCVPDINIYSAITTNKNNLISIGAQNCHWADKGAFTGETSAAMLNELNIKYAIIGHSERRELFGENDNTVNLRSKQCLLNDITPIICVGESLLQEEQNLTKQVIQSQITAALNEISGDDILNCVIAYEPIWAIGTGKTATNQQAENICEYIRTILSELYDDNIAQSISILYGGSMNAKNAKELLSMPNIDGGLIGGASLIAEDFIKIIESV